MPVTPPRYAYESETAARKRAQAQLDALMRRTAPLVSRGDSWSLLQAQRIAEQAASTTAPRTTLTPPAVRSGGSSLGRLADALRGVVPQGVRDVAGAVAQDVTSGEHALNLLPGSPGTAIKQGLESVPVVGGALGTAFDVGAAPLTLLTAGFGGEIAGALGAAERGGALARLAGGLARPVIEGGGESALGRAGLRLAGETAVGTASTLADQAVSEKTGNPLLGLVAGLGAGGLSAGALGSLRGGARAAATEELPALGKGFEPLPAAGEAAGAVEGWQPPRALAELFGAQPIEPRLSRTDERLNALKRTVGIGVEAHPDVTPLIREGDRVRDNARSLGVTAEQTVNALVKDSGLQLDRDGRIINLAPGGPIERPTLADLAARLPRYEAVGALTPEQSSAMRRIESIVQPFRSTLEEVDPTLGTRPDVVPGGFYLPRGRVVAEQAPKVAARPGMVRGGARTSAEHHAVYDSQAEAIDSGLRYEPAGAALRGYVEQTGARSFTKALGDHLKGLTDPETGLPLGETPRARMLKQNPRLRQRMDGLRQQVSSLRDAAGRLADRTDAEIARFIDSPAPDLDALADALPQRIGRNAVGVAGANFGRTRPEVQTQLRDVRKAIDDLRPAYHKALERARSQPLDRGGIAGIPQLNGTSFPAAIADAANAALQREQRISGRGAGLVKTIGAVNTLLRGLEASADVSFMGIQGLLGLARDPKAYSKALGVAFHAMRDPEALGRYLAEHDARALANGGMTSAQHAAAGLHYGTSEFELSAAGLKGLPKTLGRLEHAPVLGASNRAFSAFGDVIRTETADTLLAAARKRPRLFRVEDVERTANLMSGYSPTRFLGSAGDVALFAPRYFQAQLSLIGDALAKGGLSGQEARTTLLRLLGAGTALTIGANEALSASGKGGLPLSEIADPRSSNFMRIRLGGNDYSLFGPWDSLARALMVTAEGFGLPDAQGNVKFDPTAGARYLARSKASPVVRLAWDKMAGETFTGQDTRSGAGFLADLAQSMVPFAAQGAIGNARRVATGDVGGLAAQATNLAGIKASPTTPNEQLNAIAASTYPDSGGDFWSLEPYQRQAIKDANPDVWRRSVERGTAQRQQAEQVRSELFSAQQSNDAAALDGTLSMADWRDARGALRDEQRARLKQIYGDDPITHPRNAYERYIQIIDRHADPATDKVDWDAVDADMASLPARDRSEIAKSVGVGQTPLSQAYAKLLSDYVDLPQYRGYSAEQGRQIDALSADVNTQGGDSELRQLRALKTLTAGGGYDAKVVSAVRRRIMGVGLHADPARDRYRAAHPELKLLLASGRLTPQQARTLQGASGAALPRESARAS